jgi:hypothetical protein
MKRVKSPAPTMKNNQLIAVLTGVFFLCALTTAYNTYRYHVSTHALLDMQGRAAYVDTVRPILESLLHDTIEYSKKNPAINPLLASVTNLPAAPTPAPAPAKTPAAKPSTK